LDQGERMTIGVASCAPGESDPEDPEGPERESFVALYERYHGSIYRVCLAYLRHPADAEDAVQETFIRAVGHVEALVGDVRAYLYVIARRVCCDELRRRKPCLSLDSVSEQPVPGTEMNPEGHVLTGEALSRLWGRLSDRDRALLAQEFAGFTYQEIAHRTGLTMSTVSVGMLRARRRVRRMALSVSSVILVPAGLSRLARRALRRVSAAFQSALPVTLSALPDGGALAVALITGVAASTIAVTSARPGVGTAFAPMQLHTAGEMAPGASGLFSTATVSLSSNANGSGGTPSRPSRPGDALAAVAQAMVPNQNAAQQDVVFSSIAVSPSYERDHTAYAAGSLVNGCGGRPVCPVLFRSTDGGKTWHDQNAANFLGGRILLPPDFPADKTIFASGPAGLQRSDDGGLSFRVVVPGAADAAAAALPGTPSGGAQIAVLGPVPTVYDERTGSLHGGVVLPAGVTSVQDAAYLDSAGDLLLTASRVDPADAALRDGLALLCAPSGACTSNLVVPGEPSMAIAVAPGATSTTYAFVYSPDTVAVSSDSGRSFTMIQTSSSSPISALALPWDFGRSDAVSMVQQGRGGNSGPHPSLLHSANGGHSFLAVPSPQLMSFVSMGELSFLPDGALLAAVDESQPTFGLRCSHDGGMTWQEMC
jgi:RNA polymerase sigma-70 factor, ECF subfamily